MGVGYLSECTDFRPVSLDIYLPEWHLAVEVDGPLHAPRLDAERDAMMLEMYGIHTLRIPIKDAVWCDKAILAFIEEHAETAAERKSIWHQLQTRS